MWRLWLELAWRDVRLRYSRTIFGPFWQTISIGVFVSALGFVFSTFWGANIKSYLPFLAGGVMTWFYITILFSEGCSSFVAVTGMIKNRRLPYSVHVYRQVLRNLIVFLHYFPISMIMILWADIEITWRTLLFLPGVLLLSINGIWLGLLLGGLSARFRDIPNFISNGLTVMFFVTPIHWEPHLMMNRRPFIVELNPFHHMLEIVRAPLLNQTIQPLTWGFVAAITIGGGGLGFLAFARMRARIPYWL